MNYKISFELVLDDNDPSTPDWVYNAVQDCLDARLGEQIKNFVVEQAN